MNIGVDLGLRRDRTAIVGTHHEDGVVVLDHVKTFRAPKGGEVRVEDVENHLKNMHSAFPMSLFIVDPYQAVSSMQRLREAGLMIDEFTFSAKNITRMSQNLFTLFKDRRIRLYPHEELTKELLTVKVVERNYGMRIDHDSGRHDDHVIALAMSALESGKPAAAPLWYMGQA